MSEKYRCEVFLSHLQPPGWAWVFFSCESLGYAFEGCRAHKAKEPHSQFRVVRESDGQVMVDPLEEIEQLKARLAEAEGKRVKDQPAPQEGSGEDVWRLVMKDMEERRRVGIERYGMPLRHDNGRDHLVDAYQEALDLAVYLRAAIEQRDRTQNGIRKILAPAMPWIRAWAWDATDRTARICDTNDRIWIGHGDYEDAIQTAVNQIVAEKTRNA